MHVASGGLFCSEPSQVNRALAGLMIEIRRMPLTAREESLSEVNIGNVSGGIHGSIIAGRDVTGATITIGGQPTPADKDPTLDELKQLLTEIQHELTEIAAQKDALREVSPASPLTVQGAEENVKDAAEKLESDMKPETAQSVQRSLKEATTLLSSILDGAKIVAEKTSEVAGAVSPLAESLEPLVEKVGVAALWAAKLWLLG